MIRFIDLREQITLDKEPCFAFFDTVEDRFFTFFGEQTWCTLEEFEDSYLLEKDVNYEFDFDTYTLSRFKSLIPEGYFR